MRRQTRPRLTECVQGVLVALTLWLLGRNWALATSFGRYQRTIRLLSAPQVTVTTIALVQTNTQTGASKLGCDDSSKNQSHLESPAAFKKAFTIIPLRSQAHETEDCLS